MEDTIAIALSGSLDRWENIIVDFVGIARDRRKVNIEMWKPWFPLLSSWCKVLTQLGIGLFVVPLCPGYWGPAPPRIIRMSARNRFNHVSFKRIDLRASRLFLLENRGDPPGV